MIVKICLRGDPKAINRTDQNISEGKPKGLNMIVKICLRGDPKAINRTGQNMSEGETKGPKQDN
jgi:hypothetical protein